MLLKQLLCPQTLLSLLFWHSFHGIRRSLQGLNHRISALSLCWASTSVGKKWILLRYIQKKKDIYKKTVEVKRKWKVPSCLGSWNFGKEWYCAKVTKPLMGFGYSHDLDRIKSKQTLDFHIQGFSTALSSSHTMRRL